MDPQLAVVRRAVAPCYQAAGSEGEAALLRLLYARLKLGNHLTAFLEPASMTVAVPRLAWRGRSPPSTMYEIAVPFGARMSRAPRVGLAVRMHPAVTGSSQFMVTPCLRGSRGVSAAQSGSRVTNCDREARLQRWRLTMDACAVPVDTSQSICQVADGTFGAD
jgi:hypothetical protein